MGFNSGFKGLKCLNCTPPLRMVLKSTYEIQRFFESIILTGLIVRPEVLFLNSIFHRPKIGDGEVVRAHN